MATLAHERAAPRTYRAWLPEAALDPSAIARLLDEVARQWSAKWVARHRLRVLGPATRLAPPDDGTRWRALDDEIAIAIPGSSGDRLAAAMLDAPQRAATTDADRRLCDGLAQAALDDLCRHLSRAIRLPVDRRWRALGPGETPVIAASREYRLGGDDGSPLLRIVLSDDLMVDLRKARLPPVAPYPPLGRLETGLAAQSIVVSAALGRCALTLADLSNLGIGDVLLLDRATDVPLALALDGVVIDNGRCAVQREGDRLGLVLVEAIDPRRSDGHLG